LTNKESERLLDVDYIAEGDASLGRGDGKSGGDREDGDDKREK
jgi:hypothetical protein